VSYCRDPEGKLPTPQSNMKVGKLMKKNLFTFILKLLVKLLIAGVGKLKISLWMRPLPKV
jgi:hypothetical protein